MEDFEYPLTPQGDNSVGVSVPRVSMLEMKLKLNTTATVDSVGLDPINIVSVSNGLHQEDFCGVHTT